MNQLQPLKIKELIGKMTRLQKAMLCSGRDDWNTEAISALLIPSIRMADGPHGLRKERADEGGALQDSLPATCFPTASLLACSFDKELLFVVGEAIGKEAAREDVAVVLGPGINIKRSPLCGRNFEYYSEDPCLAGELAASWIKGLQSVGVGASVKHFAANNQENNRFVVNSCVEPVALHELYLDAFHRVVTKAKPWTVMASYNKLNNLYAGENPMLLRETLRKDWGFEGLVVSDWGGVSDRVAGLYAGLDLEMPGKASGTTGDLLEALADGRLSEDVLDEAVTRILTLVGRTDERRIVREVDFPAHDRLARRAASSSMVLMKNEGNLLPFDDGRPFAVIGNFVKSARYQGTGSSRVNPTRLTSALEELEQSGLPFLFAEGCNADGSTNDQLIREAKRVTEKASRAAVFLGLPDIEESEGFDRTKMTLPDGMLKLVDQLLQVTDSLAVFLMLGAPVELPFADRVGALVCCYLGGQAVGPAAVDVLAGRVSPSGKLAETWPKKYEDLPVHKYYGKTKKTAEYREGLSVGYRHFDTAEKEPLFSFGHGLSYSRFQYMSIGCDRAVVREGEKLEVFVKIQNTGERSAAEVVQLYIARKGERYRQLKHFQKVLLLPKECEVLHFTLTDRDFSGYDPESGAFRLIGGAYELQIGGGSRDIRLTEDVQIAAPAWRERKTALRENPAEVSAEEFTELLGFTPQEPPMKPFTRDSTLGELARSLEGQFFVSQIKHAALAVIQKENETMRNWMEQSLDDTPIRVLTAMSGGKLKRKTTDAMVHFSNRRFVKGMLALLKKERNT